MNTEYTFLLRCLLPACLVLLFAGCRGMNVSKVIPPIIEQLKADPATVEFTVIAPGVTVQFKRSWPTNFLSLLSPIPGNMLQYSPDYLPPVPKPPKPQTSP